MGRERWLGTSRESGGQGVARRLDGGGMGWFGDWKEARGGWLGDARGAGGMGRLGDAILAGGMGRLGDLRKSREGGMGRLGDLRKSREGGGAWWLEGVGKGGVALGRDMAGSEAERDSQEVSEGSFPRCKG